MHISDQSKKIETDTASAPIMEEAMSQQSQPESEANIDEAGCDDGSNGNVSGYAMTATSFESILDDEEDADGEDADGEARHAEEGDSDSDPSPAKKKRESSSTIRLRIGAILVGAGIALVAAALLFNVVDYLLNPSGELYWNETEQYQVPDGMLQGYNATQDTLITYFYDVDPDDEPYAVEYHAVVRYDSIIPKDDDDLYDIVSATEGNPSFKEWSATNSSFDINDVTNYRKIDIHLPMEAKTSVDSIVNATESGSAAQAAQTTTSQQDIIPLQPE